MGAIHRSFKEGGAASIALKAAGVLALTLAVPLRMAALHSSDAFEWSYQFPAHTGATALQTALNQAKADGKPVMIDFYADWCPACKELDAKTYPKPEVLAQAGRFINIKIDGTVQADELKLPSRRFHRQQGIFSGMHFDVQGNRLTAEQWAAKKDEFLPSVADRAYVKSLQGTAIVEPGKMANWIAPPPRGVNAKPVEFEYVRTEA